MTDIDDRSADSALSAHDRIMIDALRSRVPGFPSDFEERLDERLSDVFAPGQLQNLTYAAQTLEPGIDRGAVMGEASGTQLLYWLSRADPPEPGGTFAAKRGEYMTANAALRPLNDADVEVLYYSSLDPKSAHTWRFRGATASPEQFRAALFGNGVLAQFMVTPREQRGYGVGLVAAYAPDHSAGHCSVAVQRADNHSPEPSTGKLMLEGTLTFLSYLFDHFNFRKIYFEIPEFNQRIVEGWSESILVEEGRLKNHYYFGERFWDQIIYALYREPWDEVAALFRSTEWADGYPR